MLIAQQKRKENIAEYVLYMWQIEDQIRAFKFDLDLIEEQIINQYQVDDETKAQIRQWYSDIIQMMEIERIQKQGHLQVVKNIVIDMHDLHLRLLKLPAEIKYKELFFKALPHIQKLEEKMNGERLNETDTCLHGLYGVLLLRISNKKVSKETDEAVKTFSQAMAYLAKKYSEREKDPEKFI